MSSMAQRPLARLDPGSSIEERWNTLGPPALRFARILVGPHDAHDVMSNAFLRIEHSTGWDGVENPQSYLFRAVRNEAQNFGRSSRRRRQRDVAALRPRFTVVAESDLDVIDAIQALSVRQRSIVYLAYWEDMTETAIADTLGLSSGTVHRTLSRARHQLRKALS
jgi:RNA polymerase sigma-70 factor (ECF subfamily)